MLGTSSSSTIRDARSWPCSNAHVRCPRECVARLHRGSDRAMFCWQQSLLRPAHLSVPFATATTLRNRRLAACPWITHLSSMLALTCTRAPPATSSPSSLTTFSVHLLLRGLCAPRQLSDAPVAFTAKFQVPPLHEWAAMRGAVCCPIFATAKISDFVQCPMSRRARTRVGSRPQQGHLRRMSHY